MSSIEIRHLALDYALRADLTYATHPGPSAESVVARAKAYEAYLAGTETGDGAAQDTVPSSLPEEPPNGSVVVLRSPSTGALIVAQCRTYPNAEAAWYEFDRLAPFDWDDLIAGRDIVAVHTPDGAA